LCLPHWHCWHRRLCWRSCLGPSLESLLLVLLLLLAQQPLLSCFLLHQQQLQGHSYY
jgi:hypothetical protein